MVIPLGLPTAPTAENHQQRTPNQQPTDTTVLGDILLPALHPTHQSHTTTVWEPLHWTTNVGNLLFFMPSSTVTLSAAVSLGTYQADETSYVLTIQAQPQILSSSY